METATVPSETLSLLIGMVTLADGSLSNFTLKEAVPPASVVLSLITLRFIPDPPEDELLLEEELLQAG